MLQQQQAMRVCKAEQDLQGSCDLSSLTRTQMAVQAAEHFLLMHTQELARLNAAATAAIACVSVQC